MVQNAVEEFCVPLQATERRKIVVEIMNFSSSP
jgi:hypothetical protein